MDHIGSSFEELPPAQPYPAGAATEPVDTPQPRRFGAVNWRGLWTLYLKEVRRFLNVFTQTLLAPTVTALLFLAIFALALGGAGREVAGLNYVEFLAPGLIIMAMMQNAFANTSSSVVVSKVQGNIIDLLMAPLSPGELTLGLAGGGVTRGLLVGLVTGLAMSHFVPLAPRHPLFVLYYGVNATLMLALLGMIGGIWAEKFDHIAAVTNFVITPLTFLSGTFYSIERLPEVWQAVAHLNPFFYLIDGFRYGFLDRADTHPLLGMAVVLAVNLGLCLVAYRMLATGYRLKA
jgi:ABC-2 type transport system permease protein